MLGWRWLGCALLLATGGCALNAPLTVKGDMCHFRSIAIDAAEELSRLHASLPELRARIHA